MKKWIIVLLAAIASPAAAEVTLPSIFGDNAVLQQQQNVRIWGRSDAKEVLLKASWAAKPVRATVEQGRWSAELPTPAGSYEPQTLTVSDRDSKVVLRNLLIGEVWICSGQSNMYMPLCGYVGQPVDDALPTVLESPEYAGRIRMLTVKRRDAMQPLDDVEGRWEVPSPTTAPHMSAVGYFFARALTQALDVPVGIVSTSWGGSKIEAWSNVDDLRGMGYDIEKINADPKIHPNAKCGTLRNGMITPIAGYAARGFVWYQGESNRSEAPHYARLLERMVADWRTAWSDTENRMTFLCIQIAPHVYGDPMGIDAAQVVEAQSDAMKLIPNAALIATTDIGDANCIHPAPKRPIGERLALAALRRTYDRKELFDTEAPHYTKVEFRNGKAFVHFGELRMGIGPLGQTITGFELAGADGVFYKAKGRIVKSKSIVEVVSPAVAEPKAVRYAFRNYLPGNLINVYGHPAVPFRSDRPDRQPAQ
ncbi:MAG: sialate O-acetylesterase [Alistipes senegalensis]|nr:sialate O-acetylesterase [Bacteroides cellulosilyticus]MCM1352152.1 sialate O-acetylesterase [Alistipes senegalensis]